MMYLNELVKSWSIKALFGRGLFIVAALLSLAAASRPAHAHQASITHSTVDLDRSRTELTYRIKFEPADVSEPLGLGADVAPSAQAVAAGQERLLDYVLARITVTNRGEPPCPVERLGARMVQQGGRFVEVSWRVRCPAPFTTLAIDYDLFFDLDALHRGFLRVNTGDDSAVAELKPGESRFVWELGGAPPSSTLGFIVTGIEHIIFGFDHIAFLLGLLLVVVIMRPSPRATQWHAQDLDVGLHTTAGIVTAFTVAHSLTLIAASLDWLSLSGRLVESLIAASIVYVAIENMLQPAQRRRYLMTFSFGLIHGLGFASVLKVLLPPTDAVVPLLMFNVGVELGQLAIVLVILPLLHLTARVAGGNRYRRAVLPVGSAILAVLGALWFVERAFNVALPGF